MVVLYEDDTSITAIYKIKSGEVLQPGDYIDLTPEDGYAVIIKTSRQSNIFFLCYDTDGRGIVKFKIPN